MDGVVGMACGGVEVGNLTQIENLNQDNWLLSLCTPNNQACGSDEFYGVCLKPNCCYSCFYGSMCYGSRLNSVSIPEPNHVRINIDQGDFVGPEPGQMPRWMVLDIYCNPSVGSFTIINTTIPAEAGMVMIAHSSLACGLHP
eukprot:TRINITY_DN19837_c0_g1_i1.p1 TRINITY_DN19837_c0_g1~~TRINITY_DN19837_c0_g1_i1.p1  ORF type:complete len:160 (+),score=23.32 TRINITY_DN19837_c0_g1_i1:55-480(+)